jgi:hypothetical protein
MHLEATIEDPDQMQPRENYQLEYGEYMQSALPPPMMPPAANDQHSYVSDLTDLEY